MAWRLEKDIANEGAPPCADQVPHLDEDMNDDQALANPPLLMAGDIRDAFFQMSHAISIQAQVDTIKAQAMLT